MPKLLRGVVAAAIAVAAMLVVPSAAQAWWRGGVVVGVAPFVPAPYFVYPPPVYVPAPVYVAPLYAPPAVAAAPAQPQTCYAGSYVCPLEKALPSGTACSCPTDHAGRATGRAG